VNIATNASWILFLIGLFISSQSGIFFMNLGILLFCFAVVFQLVTVFVEFDASKRAVAQIDTMTLGDIEDVQGVKKVLSAAALTYVAALLMAILQLVRMIALRGSRD
ncbi:MAG: zinc metallopeptidase, partial [Eubacteriaceae bacterium]